MSVRGVAVALAAVLAAASLALAPGLAGASPPPVKPVTPLQHSGCGQPSAQPLPNGKPIVVTLPPYPKPIVVGKIPASWWHNPPVSDPTWMLVLRGFSWVMPLARRAAADHQWVSLEALSDQVIAFQKQRPDQGHSADGWDEGTALMRLTTLSCLYSLTGWSSLLPSIRAVVAVQFGPRYYGPPRFPVHNHGVMADLEILHVSGLVRMPSWQTLSINRLVSSSGRAWSPAGVTFEQSSGYQKLNVSLWQRAAGRIASLLPRSPAVVQIRDDVQRGTVALEWMTEPDGRLVQVGDTDEQPGTTNPTGQGAFFRDDATGWVMGRWSWRDPRTTYYTLRYGPTRWAHGQLDRPGVTFSTLGARVLVGPGSFSYETRNPFFAYQMSFQSHNAGYSSGRLRDGRVRLVSGSVTPTLHSWRTQDTLFSGRLHDRQIDVSGSRHSIRLYDHYARGLVPRQALNFDPAWRLVRRAAHELVFTRAGGRAATITTSGTILSVVRGGTAPVEGWHFPHHGVRVLSYGVLLSSGSRQLTSTIMVR